MQANYRIRAAVEKNPRKMTLQLARDLGVPEVEVTHHDLAAHGATERAADLAAGRPISAS